MTHHHAWSTAFHSTISAYLIVNPLKKIICFKLEPVKGKIYQEIVKYIEESNVVIVARLLLGKKFVNLPGIGAITNIWAIIVNPMKFVDRLEGSDTHSSLLFILELASAWATVNYWLITEQEQETASVLPQDHSLWNRSLGSESTAVLAQVLWIRLLDHSKANQLAFSWKFDLNENRLVPEVS